MAFCGRCCLLDVVFQWFVWEIELIIALRFQPVPNPYPVLFPHSVIQKPHMYKEVSKHTVLARCSLFPEEGGPSAVDQAPREKSQVWLRGHHDRQRALGKPLTVSGPRFALPEMGVTKQPCSCSELVRRSAHGNSGSCARLYVSAVKLSVIVSCVWNSICGFFWSGSVARFLWKPNQTKDWNQND